jgi:Cytochrome c554 and c-prime
VYTREVDEFVDPNGHWIMQTSKSAPTSAATAANRPISQVPSPRRWHLPSILFLIAGLAVGSAALVVYTFSDDPPKKPVTPPTGSAWSYEAVFPDWPKDRKPDFVIVITGQTYAYLQKCGCSDPQKGGLERRFNFLEGFKAHGIEVIPLDIGDVAPKLNDEYPLQHAQALEKYFTAMTAMKAMGYRAVGIGNEEFQLQLDAALGKYSLQKGNESPKVLAANIMQKSENFPNSTGGSTIADFELIATKSRFHVGVVGIVGDPIAKEAKKIDKNITFAENWSDVLTATLKTMMGQPTKPNLGVLLYNGPANLAEQAARAFPHFRIVACLTDQAEPPGTAKLLQDPKDPRLNTLLVQVGHKGQNLGVVGVFRNDKGGFDLQYQRVAMTPEFESPEGKEKDNLALKELERYSATVKSLNFLTKQRKSTHPLQIVNERAAFVGSEACMICHNDHGNSWHVYAASKHAHAYDALKDIAKKPSLRNYDPECIRCHTIGYDYNTGFIDAQKTPQLMNVGCESCHGPGSQHAANPLNKKLALELSPWKVNGQGQLPDLMKFEEYLAEKDDAKRLKIFTQAENAVILRVHDHCQKCHNTENDPHFKFEAFWPKVAHSKKAPPVKKAEENPKSTTPKN